MNARKLKLSTLACGTLLLAGGVQASTWSINVDSGETTVLGTIPAGTDAISKTGAGGYILSSTGPNAFHGEASVVGTLRITGNSLDMDGETISKTGSGWFQFWDLSVLNPGDIVCRQGAITLIGTTNLGEPGSHKLSFGDGTTLQLNSLSGVIGWPVELGAVSVSEAGGATSDNHNKITGPVTVSGDTSIATASRLNVAGDFSMTSGKVLTKSNPGVLHFGGKTTMDGVTVWMDNGLISYGCGADVTGCLPSSKQGGGRPVIKIDDGAKVSYNGTGNGYGTLGFNNYAAFWMTGGQVDISLDWGWRIGQLGGADLLVSGGELDIKSGLVVLGNDADNGTKKHPYTMSVSGETSLIKVNNSICSGAAGAILNVSHGAALSTRNVYANTAVSSASLTVNFDNAIFKPRYYAASTGSGATCARILIQDGGLVYDTTDVVDDKGAGSYSVVNSALEKPTGMVVAEIGLPTAESDPSNFNAFSAASYSTPAPVRISGTGAGASAFLEIDEITRKPVRIVVTGAGSGYDEEHTTVTLDSPDGSSRYVCPVTLKTPAGTGSLVKRGANSLVLYGANTYGGATILEAGWTKFSGDVAYPQGSPLTVKQGAYFQTENRTIPYRVKSLAGTGAITAFDKGMEVSEKLVVDLADLRAGRSMTCNTPLAIGKDVIVQVVDSEGLWTPVTGDFIKVDKAYAITCASALATVAEQDRWKAVIKDNCLCLKPERGLTIIFR